MRPRADVVGAHAATDAGRYQRDADGAPYPHSTAPDVVLAMLRLLDLPRGGSVYEVGTGSGFATAVLARAVGPAGRVHSVDVDPGVVARAGTLLADLPAVTLAVADALREPPPDGPYDRLVAFLSVADGPPTAWVAAVRRGGRLVVPVRGTNRVVRYRVGEPGELVVDGGITARFAG